ncbi:MAG: hypothetical protein JNL65_11195 [Saprospiraceae bacterium]|nr:hypothetical protein [Saprospiraceae bacterium]
MKFIKGYVSLMLFGVLSITACLDHDFDKPPQPVAEIGFDPNSSIAELKSKYVSGKFTTITNDFLIHATVVADDKSGNFYKTIVIQDSTGGIELKLNRTGIYTDFPVGMKIGLKCKGLTIGDYNGLIQLGLGTYQNGNFTNLSGIEDVLIDQYVFKGPKNQSIVAKKKTISTLTAQDISTLIQLDNIEFARSDTGTTYADIVAKVSVNHTLTDCNKNEILLRTSNFADFAGTIVPSKNGSITAILSKYQSDAQLYIRNLNDVDFSNEPCLGGGNLTQISILDLRNLFTGSIINAPSNKKIIGTVISDRVNMNTTSRNLIIQDLTGGITIRFTANHSFNLGDQLQINISDQELSEFDGLLQLNNVDNANATKTGTGLITPAKKTLAEIISNFENLESTLVEVSNVNISKSGSSTYSGTCNLNDGTGSLLLFTRTQALFANDNFPATPVKLIAMVTQGGTNKDMQLTLRNASDISGGGGGGTPQFISLRSLRSLYLGATTSVPANRKIHASVVSDVTNGSTTTKNIHVQDSSGGMVIRFTVDHSFVIGDDLEIDISSQELSEFSGLLEVNNVPLANAKKIGTNIITPTRYTINQIVQNFEALESTLVEISGVTISKSSGTTFSGTCILTDATGTMDLYTRSQASFANTNFQTSPVKIVGVVNQGGATQAKQISVRSLNDITP